MEPLSYATVDPTSKHTATFIFLHGLGDCGYRWEPVAEKYVNHPALSHVKWVLPNSPSRAVTANRGAVMPSWFDLYNFGVPIGPEDEEGMLQSRQKIYALMDKEVQAGIQPSRIVLGGLSQGGVMTYFSGLTTPVKLAGLVLLSTRLGAPHKVKEMAAAHVAELPIFCAHGTADDMVHIDRCRTSLEFLKDNFGVRVAPSPGLPGVTLRVYEGLQHTINPQELDDMRVWLEKVLPPT
ncbi:Phospholipase/carboxylesterase/thioesterase [Schizophyllum amplum]|uniref:Acyl-protein thioesterase 1 n=1 Tax=Schizophyllum amplum TaxID=97359 RepID=A0A550CJP2_9AGAR|nr:Phospholipase/carboxylesterase/thioesterase [Auriculariopsis ampla]